MGVVYRARDRKLGRLVALKQLLTTGAGDERAAQRFWREARTIAALDHFNIVRIYNVLEEQGSFWIEMELVEGGSLEALIQQEGALSIARVCDIGRQLCDALAVAHNKGIIHRDVKPANVLLTDRGTPKLADFGLARDQAADAAYTMTGSLMGTMLYAAPEQLVSGKHVDERSDIYALGATLYVMATGQKPRIVRLDLVPSELRELIGKCLEEHPDRRYASAKALSEALRDAVEDRTTPTVTASTESACPNCGYDNPLDVQFCQKCGSGLFHKCPKCTRENRIDIEYCGGCGLNLPAYRTATAALDQAKAHLEKREYDEAITAAKAGLSTGELQDELQESLRTASSGLERVSTYGEPFINSIGMELVHIEPGTFMMGTPEDEDDEDEDDEDEDDEDEDDEDEDDEDEDDEDEDDEGPQHRVTLRGGFYMGVTQVTQAQWRAVMGMNPSEFKGDDLPVERVSWDDAVAFCEKLSRSEGRTYRLPSEAEWEYACRAGMTTRFCFGDDEDGLGRYGWYEDNSNDETNPVASKQPNAWGLHDMHGNVWEWCQDWYDSGYYGRSPAQDPTNTRAGTYRVLRGGSWYSNPWGCQSAYRGIDTPATRNLLIGFRVCLD